MSSIDEQFGQVRSLMNAGPGQDHDAWSQRLRYVLRHAHDLDPRAYASRWVPYMEGFTGHWERALWTARDLGELEAAHALAPFATFALELRAKGVVRASRSMRLNLLSGEDTRDENRIVKGFEVLRSRLGRSDRRTRGTRDDRWDGDLEGLLEHPLMSSVSALDLGFRRFGDPGARALAVCARAHNLRVLALAGNFITDDGARALAASAHLVQLERLDLSDNRIGPEGALALARSERLAELEDLLLRRNPIGAQGRAQLETLVASRRGRG